MYHYYFDKGTVYLPSKKHENIPVIISNYAHDAPHWPKRVEEDVRVAALKAGLGMVVFRETDLTAMLDWVAAKKFAHPRKLGLFLLGLQNDLIAYHFEMTGLAFKVVTLASGAAVDLAAFCAVPTSPALFLQGAGAKVTLEPPALGEGDILRQHDERTKSAAIRWSGSDDYLYNVSRQAADEIIQWVKGVVV